MIHQCLVNPLSWYQFDCKNKVNLINLRNDWQKTDVKPYFKPRPLSKIPTIMPQAEFEPMQNLVQDLLNELKNLTNSENYYNRVDSISEINKKSVKHLLVTKKCQCKLR